MADVDCTSDLCHPFFYMGIIYFIFLLSIFWAFDCVEGSLISRGRHSELEATRHFDSTNVNDKENDQSSTSIPIELIKSKCSFISLETKSCRIS